MARSAIAAQCLVRDFGDVRPAHHHGDAGGAQGVSDAVGFGDHARHGADSHQPDSLLESELDQFGIGHGLGIAVDQQDFMAGRRKRLQQEHPEVRHEVLGHAVVGVI